MSRRYWRGGVLYHPNARAGTISERPADEPMSRSELQAIRSSSSSRLKKAHRLVGSTLVNALIPPGGVDQGVHRRAAALDRLGVAFGDRLLGQLVDALLRFRGLFALFLLVVTRHGRTPSDEVELL